MNQRLLSAAEVTDLRSRNFELNGKVLSHERIVESGFWSRNQSNLSTFTLPIPTKGVVVQDDKYGQVVVFPSLQDGTLHYNGWVSSTTLAGEINKPTFESPNSSIIGNIMDGLSAAASKVTENTSSILASLVILGILYIVITNRQT